MRGGGQPGADAIKSPGTEELALTLANAMKEKK
jgi:hypothetical protein